VCCVEHCGNAATHGAWCACCFEEYTALNEMWAHDQLKRTDPARLARKAAAWRFFNGFVVMGAAEFLIAYAIEAPCMWQTFAVGAAWAALIAGMNVTIGGKKKRVGRNG
jgi:hypothetical protein